MGPEVEALEQALADHVGVRHVVSCANGTDALLLVLLARGIGPGDAVFVPAFTFAASAEAVALAGATPVLVDVGADFTLDSASLEEAIEAVRRESALRPRAVVAVDLFGQPARYESLVADRARLTGCSSFRMQRRALARVGAASRSDGRAMPRRPASIRASRSAAMATAVPC